LKEEGSNEILPAATVAAGGGGGGTASLAPEREKVEGVHSG